MTANQSIIGTGLTITNTGVTSNVAGTGISVSGATGAVTVTNTGVISGSCPGGFLTCSGTNPLTFTLGTLGMANGGTGTSTNGIAGQNIIIGPAGNTMIATSSLFVASTQNVGIGTTSPEKLLMVEGNQSGGVARIQRDFAASTNQVVGTYDVTLNETGGLQDLTGPAQTFSIRGNGGTVNTVGDITAVRAGADTTGNISLRGYTTGSPSAQLSVNGSNDSITAIDQFGTIDALLNMASTTGSIFTVAATTSPVTSPIKLFDIDQYGGITASSTGATPTVSCAPSGGTISTNSNDQAGTITTGTLSTSCTLTFTHTKLSTPIVEVTGSNTTNLPAVSARSTSSFTISMGASTSDVLEYFVVQP